jgi:hypothetical protein
VQGIGMRNSWVRDEFDLWHWRRWAYVNGQWFIPDKNTHCQQRIDRSTIINGVPPKPFRLCDKCRAEVARRMIHNGT